MPIRKRGDVYYIDLYTPSGERIRRTIKTTVKKEAQQYHDQLKAQLWQIDKLDRKPDYLFENALVLFLKDAEGKEDTATKKRHAIYFREKFAGRILSSLTSDEILDSIPERHMSKGTPLTNATKNKYRTSIMRILKLAYQAGYIDKMPYIPKKKEPPIRVRWISQEQARQLISHISTDWMKIICSFALMTGARRTEILSMTWDKIDFVRKIAIVSNDIAKSEKARSLLLNEEAIRLLQQQKGKHGKYVFVGNKGQPLQDINRKIFDKATEKCLLADFHFHDLRHTWASWHVQAGTPLFTLKELGGWETLEMVKKYAHLNADHLLNHANSVKF